MRPCATWCPPLQFLATALMLKIFSANHNMFTKARTLAAPPYERRWMIGMYLEAVTNRLTHFQIDISIWRHSTALQKLPIEEKTIHNLIQYVLTHI